MLRRLREPELARSLLGYDENETGRLLELAAAALEAAYEERDRIRSEARRTSLEAAAVPSDLEAIGRALLTATETGEQIVGAAQQRAEDLIAHATAEAETIRAEAVKAREHAEREGEQIGGAAQQRAEELIAHATAEAETIRAEAVKARERAEREIADERAALEREREEEQRRLVADRQEAVVSARAEANRLIAQARTEVERLRGQAEKVTALMESKRTVFVEMAGAALEHLERLEGRPGDESDSKPQEALPKPLPPVR